jgi:tryptophan halogenase
MTDLIEMWRTRPPSVYDFTSSLDCFPMSSYRFVLYGMGFRTSLNGQEANHRYAEQAAREFQRIQIMAGRAAASLPDHRALMDGLYAAA